MKVESERLIQLYRTMLTIRRFEETVWDLYRRALMPGLAHLYIGEEAVAAGACAALGLDDLITSTHRGHGHLIARGGRLDLMVAEMLGKETGYCKGRGGTMHIADPDIGVLGAFGIVGAGLGVATGSALASKMQGIDRVTLCFFGDGASNLGIFHESLNLAGLWQLPVVYVCENNLYAISTSQTRHQPIKDIAERASSYGLPGVVIDGQDVVAVYTAVREAVEQARKGGGPTLIECKTYRYGGHHVGDPGVVYRTREETDNWRARDPILLLEEKLRGDMILDDAGMDKIKEEVEQAMAEAVKFALDSPFPPESDAGRYVFTQP